MVSGLLSILQLIRLLLSIICKMSSRFEFIWRHSKEAVGFWFHTSRAFHTIGCKGKSQDGQDMISFLIPISLMLGPSSCLHDGFLAWLLLWLWSVCAICLTCCPMALLSYKMHFAHEWCKAQPLYTSSNRCTKLFERLFLADTTNSIEFTIQRNTDNWSRFQLAK